MEKPSLLRVIINLSILMIEAGTLKNSADQTKYSSSDHHRNCNTMVISVYHGQCSCFSYAILCGSDGVANSISAHDKVQSSHCRTPETRQVREIFHHVLEDYPDFKKHVANNAQIVHDEFFDLAVLMEIMKAEELRNAKKSNKVAKLRVRHMLYLPLP